MSNSVRSQGILPMQMNMDLLAKVFPILSTNPAESITIRTNETTLTTEASQTLVLVGKVSELELPTADNAGLTYIVQNNTDHDVKLKYAYTPNGTTEELHFEFVIHPSNMWRLFWDGTRWVATDLSIEEYIRSSDQEYSPAISKTVIFDVSEDTTYGLANGLNPGVELSLFNPTQYDVNVLYLNGGITRKLWLPANSKYHGILKWDGESWLNKTQDEWVLPFDAEDNKEDDNEFITIKKDINNSILHIAPCSANKSWIILDEMGIGTTVECVLDDSLAGTQIGDITLHPRTDQRSIKIYDHHHMVNKSDYCAAISNAMPTITVRFDGKQDDMFEFTPSHSASKGHIESDLIDEYDICGIHNDIVIDIENISSIQEIIFNVNQRGDTKDTVPIGTKIYIKNSSSHSVSIGVDTVRAGEDEIDEIANDFHVLPKNNLALVHNGYTFIQYDMPIIGRSFVTPLDGHILQIMSNWVDYNEDTLRTLVLRKDSKFQMESPNGKLHVFHAVNDHNIKYEGNIMNWVGKDVYLYLVGGVSEDDETCEFEFSTLLPKAFQTDLVSRYNENSVSMILGGGHVGVMRKTDPYGIPLKLSNGHIPDSEEENDWCDPENIADESSWMSNVVIGFVPNSVWDISHRPTCYDVSRTDRQLGGMGKFGNLWMDLYKASGYIERTGGKNGPVVSYNVKSVYGEIPITDWDYFSAVTVANLLGKRLPTRQEWIAAAEWTPGNIKTSDYAAQSGQFKEIRTGCFVDGSGNFDLENGKKKFNISAHNMCNMVGVIGEIVDEVNYAAPGTGAWAWGDINGSPGFGKSYTPNGIETVCVMGGDFSDINPGPRCTKVSNTTKNDGTSLISARFCCESTL